MSKIRLDKATFNNIVKECYSIADICRKLGWQPRGGNYRAVHRYLEEYSSDISHFTGKRSNIRNLNNKDKEKKVDEYLKKNSYAKSSRLKWKILANGLKEYKCEICGCNQWNGKQIALQLHHINGDETDNKIENLQLLCPNCHSQTDNFCGRNIKRNEKTVKYYCKNCGKEIERTLSGLCDKCYEKLINSKLSPLESFSEPRKKMFGKCIDCGKEIAYGSTRCQECYAKSQRKVERPTKEVLEDLIKTTSFTKIGKTYGVSDQAIRKWCKQYNLPYRKKDMHNTK